MTRNCYGCAHSGMGPGDKGPPEVSPFDVAKRTMGLPQYWSDKDVAAELWHIARMRLEMPEARDIGPQNVNRAIASLDTMYGLLRAVMEKTPTVGSPPP